jgi:hypothetical protein
MDDEVAVGTNGSKSSHRIDVVLLASCCDGSQVVNDDQPLDFGPYVPP